MTSTVDKYYELVDANDVEGLLALFAQHAWYERPGYDRLTGRTALQKFYSDDRVIDSGQHTILRKIVSDDAVAIEGTFAGRLKDGRHVSLGFADFFELTGELIQGRRTYFYTALV